MKKYNYTENDFIKVEDFFKLKEPHSSDSKTRKYYKKICPSCNNTFFTSKSESLTCSDKCRSLRVRKENSDILSTGHYEKKTSNNQVELFTKSGYRFLVDNDDLDSVSRIGWTRDAYGYLTSIIRISESESYHVKLHRFIMKATDGEIIDHINGDVSDNRKSNLRRVDKSVNALNQKNRNIKKSKDKYIFRISWLSKNFKRNTFQRTFSTLSEAEEFSQNFKKEIIELKLNEYNSKNLTTSIISH